MSERMTDERLAFLLIQPECNWPDSWEWACCHRELLIALKAERELVQAIEQGGYELKQHIAELQATIKRVKEVRNEMDWIERQMDWADPESRNYWKSQLDKALEQK